MTEQNQEREVTFKQFMDLIKRTDPPIWMLVVGVLGSMVATAINLVIPLLVQSIIDGSSLEFLNVHSIIGIAVVLVLQLLATGFSSYLLAKFGQYIVAKLRERVWLKMIHMPVHYFDQNTSGELSSRVVNDTSTIQNIVSSVFSRVVNGVLTIVGVLALLFIMDWQMTLMMILAIPLMAFIILPLGKKIRKNSRDLQDETAEFSGNVQESLSEMRLLKSSTAEVSERKRGQIGINKIYQLGLTEAKIFAVIQPVISLLMILIFVGILAYGGFRVSTGSLTIGNLVAFIMYLFQIMAPIITFSNFFTHIQRATGATSRIIEILELDEEAGHSEGEMVDVSNLPIHFDRVDFNYKKGEQVLADVSFSAYPDQKLAFVGPSGGGKTTIFSLLERFYEPSSGQIYIEDKPISEISLKSWRSQIGYVSQENSLLSGTIRENLLYGLERPETISEKRLWEVVEMAYAKAFIKDLPDEFDTQIGERGIKLSGGQRQRINISRAFLRDPKILLLDEATASLDSQSEKVVQEALERLMDKRTTLVIAHRLSTIVDADHILIVEKGRITGRGTHQELLENNEVYQTFSKQQLTWE